jgi:Flp pilus assembly protein TadD
LPTALIASAVVVAGLWAYAPSFRGAFFLDDVRAIVRNPTIRTLWPISTPLSPPTASTVAGRPIANLSFAVNYALAPDDARETFTPRQPGSPSSAPDERFLRNVWGYHAANLAVHLVAALLLFGIVRRTLRSPRLRVGFGHDDAGPAPVMGSSADWLAGLVALVWVVHPLNTAAVTYLVQRVESLMSLFLLLTLYCAIRASEGEHGKTGSGLPVPGSGRTAWGGLAIASCALGMGSKEVMVTAPVIVWLWYWVFAGERRRPPRWIWAGLAATWLVAVALVAQERRAPSLALGSDVVWRYLLTQAAVVTHYVRLAIWPSPLVFLYDWPLAASLTSVAWQAALLATAAVLTVVGLLRRRPLAFVGACFFVILAPTSSVLPIVTEVAAEHRMYLPLAALIAGTVVGTFALARAGMSRTDRASGESITRAACAVVAIVLVGVFGTMTRERDRMYTDPVALWGATVAAQPSAARPRVAFGEALAADGRLVEAETELTTAVRLDGAGAPAWVRLATVQAAQGELAEATASFERALALDPNDLDAHRGLGRTYAMSRQDARAVPHLERALSAEPNDLVVLLPLAAILVEADDPMLRNPRRALELAERAVAVTSRRDPVPMELLAGALAASGRVADATGAAREALSLARAQGNAALASRLEMRLRGYEAYAGFPPSR